jgi:hypothetical protein
MSSVFSYRGRHDRTTRRDLSRASQAAPTTSSWGYRHRQATAPTPPVVCGRDAPTSGVASLSRATTTAKAAPASKGSSSGGELGEYAACMRSDGISNFPDSFGSSAAIKAAKGQMVRITDSEASSPTFQAAQRACVKYYGPTTASTQVSSAEMQKFLAVSRCMRSHGVPSFPDPNPTTGQLSTPAGLDTHSPEVLAALRACQSLGQAAGLGTPHT